MYYLFLCALANFYQFMFSAAPERCC